MTKSISNIKPNVDLIELDSKKIYLVGTAHISRESVDLVLETIQEFNPDTVAIELCEPRFRSLKDPNRWKNTDIYKVMKDGQAYVLMAQLVLSAYQKKLARDLQVKPGEEMMAAVEAAEKRGSAIALVDRNVRTSLKRAWAKASWWSMLKMFTALLVSLIVPKKVTKEEVEAIKQGDVLHEMISEFASFLPGVKNALIDERDQYMAAKIAASPGATIVAVVGAGHVPGIKALLGTDIDIAPLEVVPPKSMFTHVMTWAIPVLLVLMVGYGFAHSGRAVGMEMLGKWALATAVLGAVGAVLSFAHPLSILSAFIAAPFTTSHAGWVSGLVEAVIRKPKVRDLEALGDDILSFTGLWRNGVTRILLVCAFTNIGATIGAIIGFTSMASRL